MSLLVVVLHHKRLSSPLLHTKKQSGWGFTFVSSDLIAVGNKARLIISLVCSNYDKDILGRLLMAEL